MYDKYFKNAKFDKFVFLYDIKNKKVREPKFSYFLTIFTYFY